MDRNMRTVDDVLRLLDGLFAPEADRWTANAGACWWDSFYADRSTTATPAWTEASPTRRSPCAGSSLT